MKLWRVPSKVYKPKLLAEEKSPSISLDSGGMVNFTFSSNGEGYYYHVEFTSEEFKKLFYAFQSIEAEQ